ncbi:MAG: hypothetical protein ACE15F_09710 [bacterium]
MKTGKWIATGLLVVTVLSAGAAFSSTFRLKNMPEAYAKLEGAILEEDAASITIMTRDNVLVKGLDAIEILQRTPAEDKQFIAQYGPANAVYQEYLKRKNKLPVTPAAETKSAAKPGEKFTLRYQYTKNEISYLVYNASGQIKTKTGKVEIAAGNQIHIVKTLLTKEVNAEGAAVIDLGTNLFTTVVQIGANQRKKDQTSQVKNQVQTFEYDPRGVLISGESFLKATLEEGAVSTAEQIGQFLFTILPKQAVAVGETWTEEVKYDNPGGTEPVVFHIESVLDDVILEDGAKVALITTKTSMRLKDLSVDPKKLGIGGGLPQYAGQKITIHSMALNQVMKSRFLIESGRLSTADETSGIQVSMTMPGNMAVDSDVKMEATRTYTKQKPDLEK